MADPKTIYGATIAHGTQAHERPCMVGHSKPSGGEWYFWPADYGEFVPGFSDPHPTQDAAEAAAVAWGES